MRILHIIQSIDSATGGPVEGLRQRCNIYRAHGHEVEIASIDSPEVVAKSDLPATLVGLGPGLGIYGYSRRAIPWLRANLARFDIVFVNGIWNYNTFAAHRALAGTDVPWAIFAHGMLDPYFKKRFPVKHLKKLIYWHSCLRFILRDAHAVLFTCEEERLLARQSFPGHKVSEVVVPYGTFGPDCDIDGAAGEFLAQHPNLRGKRLAMYLGRIHPKKGVEILIEAFAATLAQDPAWQLAIVGPDTIGWQKELEALASRLGVSDRIAWTGPLEGAAKWGALAASEVFVLPSHQENFGIVVAEALACATPVILSDKVNIWREVVNHRAGLVADDTLDGTVASLRRWGALTAEEIAGMRVRSRECFRAEFDFAQTSVKAMENVESLARETPRYKPSSPMASAVKDGM
jgi:glycosyltransferase involved in cell wall biosynthesis